MVARSGPLRSWFLPHAEATATVPRSQPRRLLRTGVRTANAAALAALRPSGLLLLLLLLAACASRTFAAASSVGEQNFGVRARVVSSWPRTSSQAQSLEWFRDIDPVAAVQLLLEAGKSGKFEQDEVEAKLMSGAASSFLDFLVKNRYYSPRIESIRSFERRDRRTYGAACEPGSAWALLWVSGTSKPIAACDAKSFSSELERVHGADSAGRGEGQQTQAFAEATFDLVLSPAGASGVAVIYGSVSRDAFGSLAGFLREVSSLSDDEAKKWHIIFRHADETSLEPGALIDVSAAENLTGYGFELAIKNSEYRTHAEDKVVDEEVDKETEEEMKAKLEDVGLKAVARILTSDAPLLTLMKLSQDYPTEAKSLLDVEVPDDLRQATMMLRQMVSEDAEVFSFNGRLVRPDHDELSLFPLVAKLLPFVVGIERLVKVGVSEKTACEMLKQTSSPFSAERLEWRSTLMPPPVYDVMKDKETAQWSPSLQALFFSFGGLAPVRKPLYNIVYTFDPLQVADLKVAATLLDDMPLPATLRFVLVPGGKTLPESSTSAWNEEELGAPPAWLQPSGEQEPGQVLSAYDISATIASCHGYLLAGGLGGAPATGGARRARVFIKELLEVVDTDSKTFPLGLEGLKLVRTAFVKSLSDKVDREAAWEEMLRSIHARHGWVANATQYVASFGLPIPSVLLNGKLMLPGSYQGEQSFHQGIAMEQMMIQRAAYRGLVSDGSGIDDFLEAQGLLPAYHPDITPELAHRGGEEDMGRRETSSAYLQWPSGDFLRLPFLASVEGRQEETEQDPPSADSKTPVKFFHVLALTSTSQLPLLRTFATHLLSPERSSLKSQTHLKKFPPLASRLGLLFLDSQDQALQTVAHCVDSALSLSLAETDAEDDETEDGLNRRKLQFLKYLGSALPAAEASLAAVGGALDAEKVSDLCKLAASKKLGRQLEEEVSRRLSQPFKNKFSSMAATATNVLRKHPGAALWTCNGRQILLHASTDPIVANHVQVLERLELQLDVGSSAASGEPGEDDEEDPQASTKTLPEWLKMGEEAVPEVAEGLVAAARSAALSAGSQGSYALPARIFEMAPPELRLTLAPTMPDKASPLKVYGLINPLSEIAQSASAALALFGMFFNTEVNLVLSPNIKVSAPPLKRFYREVVSWPEKLIDGRSVSSLPLLAGLKDGNAEVILSPGNTFTAALHVLPTWLVTAHRAVHDMDNLRGADVGVGNWCDAVYMLRQLYTEGQAFVLDPEGWPVEPAKGLQFEVGRKGESSHDDTLVMGNHGYFQVRGDPGQYEVRLKAGRSNTTFQLARQQDLEVTSYITPPFQLRVTLREGHSSKDLFEERQVDKERSEQQGGERASWTNWISSFFGSSQQHQQHQVAPQAPVSGGEAEEALPTIHIFSVASGHLYEKLLSIMVLSVRKTTKCPLHFWFIDNFLSPRFKAFIPRLAERYGFSFDFVTYKWPSWLNPQSEKQRLIWAYKVLFLDVLFPLNVPKVIFVDADQVVRADVRELWDMDLEGHVYGWVPMGDSNPDTEGFRFWKQGYWQNHLGPLKYHIAALYVVDLIEFRRQSIGDTLRGVYNMLSQDPNSLSNLEQDLVNFAQRNVPIFSLPDEWLWCETWCSQESKAKAKTIDLCQNPLTKEPKIVMARRIISEWATYHDQVQKLLEETFNDADEQRAGSSTPGGKSPTTPLPPGHNEL